MPGYDPTFEILILPHRGALLAQAYRLTGSADEAEDLVQETLVRAYTRRDMLRGSDTAKAWLHTILGNLFVNDYHRRRRGPRLVSLGRVQERASGAPSPEQVVLRRMESAALLRAVWELPGVYQDVLVLADLEGCSYQEIAARLRLPVGTVRSRLSRARRRVGRSLGGP
jgi:RNA polymerase sigma-70 factor (ECF subfamily)